MYVIWWNECNTITLLPRREKRVDIAIINSFAHITGQHRDRLHFFSSWKNAYISNNPISIPTYSSTNILYSFKNNLPIIPSLPIQVRTYFTLSRTRCLSFHPYIHKEEHIVLFQEHCATVPIIRSLNVQVRT